jgi:uncharacterized protein YjdB
MFRSAARSAPAALALTVLAAACAGGEGAPEPVASVRFTLASDTLSAGIARSYAAAALDAGGAPLAGRTVTYATSDAARAAVDGAGLVRGLAPGPVTITAASEGRTASLALDVRPSPPARVALAGVDSALVGDVGTLTATVFNALGVADASYPVTFATTVADVVTVDADGRVTALNPGAATITASVTAPSGQVVTASLPYVALAPVAALTVLPRRVDLAVGAAAPLLPVALDAAGSRLSRRVTFATTNPAAARVGASAGGGSGGQALLEGVAAGTATVTATSSFRGRNTVTATVPVAVAPVAQGPFRIDLRFDGSVNPAYAAVFQQAAAFWESVITEPLPPYPVALDAGVCGNDHPAVNTTTTGVIIGVRVDSIDGAGKVLGSAGPCDLRDGPGGTLSLPAFGTMRFDSADVGGYVRTGRAYDLIRHEMGHVLGVGSLWRFAIYPATAPLVVDRNTRVVAYVGPGGVEASATLGFTPPDATAPVEDQGGPGTANAHWRETVYGSELMTGFLNSGGNPASRVTVRALADLGYAVNLAAAEAFLPASLASASVREALGARAGSDAAVIAETVLAPRFAGGRPLSR